MRFSALIALFTASLVVALPAALESESSPVEVRAIECPPKSAANTACTAGRGAFNCNGSYVSHSNRFGNLKRSIILINGV